MRYIAPRFDAETGHNIVFIYKSLYAYYVYLYASFSHG